jgi:hypothetical protein
MDEAGTADYTGHTLKQGFLTANSGSKQAAKVGSTITQSG